MPLENLEEEGLPKNPDLRIAQLRFLLSLRPRAPDPAAREELMAAVRLHSECGLWGGLCPGVRGRGLGLPPLSWGGSACPKARVCRQGAGLAVIVDPWGRVERGSVCRVGESLWLGGTLEVVESNR